MTQTTQNTKSFKEFKLEPLTRTFFTGDKIDLLKILNTEIIIHKCKIEPSTQNSGLCLHMQIEFRRELRVVFTGAIALIDAIKKLPEDPYPFTATIVKNDQMYEFT